MSLLLRDFERADALDAALSERLIDGLVAAIDARGEAILAVSGGRTGQTDRGPENGTSYQAVYRALPTCRRGRFI